MKIQDFPNLWIWLKTMSYTNFVQKPTLRKETTSHAFKFKYSIR